MTLRPAVFDRHVPAFNEARFLRTLVETLHEMHKCIERPTVEKPDHWHCRLLCARRDRPHDRTAEKANELTSPHIRTPAQGPALYRLKRVLRWGLKPASKPLPQCTANIT